MREPAHGNAGGGFSRAPFGRTGVWALVLTVLAIWTTAAIAGCQRQAPSSSTSTSARQSGASTTIVQAASYQAAIAELVPRFDHSLASARKRLATAESANGERKAAEGLASLCGETSDQIGALRSNPSFNAAKLALALALNRCAIAYRTLAKAAGRLRPDGYVEAVKAVYTADAAIVMALSATS